jgi:hypothetical protein
MHIIRLREPWIVETHPDRVVYRRYFNLPTGLGPDDAVRLVIEQLVDEAKVTFNSQPLAHNDSAAWEITPWLFPRNAVEVSIRSETLPARRPFGEVRLELSQRPRTPAA